MPLPEKPEIPVTIAPSAHQAILRHGEEAYPDEGCGVLLGWLDLGIWRIHSAVPARNASTGSERNRYSIDPVDLIRIERAACQQGLDIAGFYHSHPDYPAAWSATDLAEAHWLSCLYAIVSVQQNKAAALNLFLLAGASEEDKRFLPQPFLVGDPGKPSP